MRERVTSGQEDRGGGAGGGGAERDNSELGTLLHKNYDIRQLPILTICP